MSTHRLTPAQFAETFADAKLNLFGVIEHLAQVKTLQKDRNNKTPAAEIVPGGEVHKWQRCYFQALGDYETAVRNAQARDAQASGGEAAGFDADAHSWAKPFGDSKIIRVHKDWPERPGFYLQVRCPKSLPVKVEYRDRQGNTLPFDRIAGILPTSELPDRKAAARVKEAEHQGVTVENLVVIRDYGVGNIVSLAYGGETYQIITEAEAEAEIAAEAARQNAADATTAAEAAENAARAAEAATATAEQIAARFEQSAREAAARFEAAAAPRPGTRQHVGAAGQMAEPAPAEVPATVRD